MAEKDEKTKLEMRIAELEDKLAKLHITEEEMRAYEKVSSLMGGLGETGNPVWQQPGAGGPRFRVACIGGPRFIVVARFCYGCACGPYGDPFSGGGGFGGFGGM